MDRRRFLQLVGMGSAYAFARTRGAAFAQVMGGDAPFSDYKALVCLFLFGGNDSWNMVVPSSNAEYNTYATSRQNLAIARDTLAPIRPIGNGSGRAYGFHPAMAELATLFEQEKVAVVANVGPLLGPTSLDAYRSRGLVLPPQLFSHNDQQSQWQALHGRAASKSGWAGRMAEVLSPRLSGQFLAMNTSLFGQTLFQTSSSQVAYTIGGSGPVRFTGLGTSGLSVPRKAAFSKLLDPTPPYRTIYERAFAETQARAMASAETITAALASAPTLNTVFPTSALSTQLSTVAKLIAVRDQLRMKRQVFFVAAGGFDTHDDQNENQPVLLGDVSRAVAAFYRATVELGVADRVTTFTQSDFGRTLTSNGDGTDHAWGGVQLVVGGAVAGRKIVGQYPVLRIGARLGTDGADDVGGGRFIPTLSSDQYAATLARWFGVGNADLVRVAPSIGNFQEKDLRIFV